MSDDLGSEVRRAIYRALPHAMKHEDGEPLFDLEVIGAAAIETVREYLYERVNEIHGGSLNLPAYKGGPVRETPLCTLTHVREWIDEMFTAPPHRNKP